MTRLLRAASVAAFVVCYFSAGSLLSALQDGPAPAGPAATPNPGAGRGAGRQGGRGGPPLVSPEVAADGRVTFRLRAPNAKGVVATVGQRKLPMVRNDQGVWSATSDVLAPDYYTYSFVVDGTTIHDPANRQVQTSYGTFQPMFVVPGPEPWLPAPNVPRGAIARHPFRSAVAGDERAYFVYTPPGYDARRSRPYPVIFLLHGLGDDAERWLNGGGANVILDNLIAQGKAVPMVMVTTLGYGVSNGPAGAMAPESITGYTKILLEEIMPAVERSYHVSRNREQRAIAGLSMGGAETLFTGLNNLDKFAWMGSFSGAFVMWPGVGGGRRGGAPPAGPAAPETAPPAPTAPATGAPAAGAPTAPAAGAAPGRGGGGAPVDAAVFAKIFPKLDAKSNSQIKMLWITCGTADGLVGINRQFKDWLRSKNVAFTELEVPDVGHVWPLWRQNFAELAQKVFK